MENNLGHAAGSRWISHKAMLSLPLQQLGRFSLCLESTAALGAQSSAWAQLRQEVPEWWESWWETSAFEVRGSEAAIEEVLWAPCLWSWLQLSKFIMLGCKIHHGAQTGKEENDSRLWGAVVLFSAFLFRKKYAKSHQWIHYYPAVSFLRITKFQLTIWRL